MGRRARRTRQRIPPYADPKQVDFYDAHLLMEKSLHQTAPQSRTHRLRKCVLLARARVVYCHRCARETAECGTVLPLQDRGHADRHPAEALPLARR